MRAVKRYIQNHSVATVLNAFILPVLLCVMLLFGLASALIYQDVVSRHLASELQMNTGMYADYLNSYLSEIVRLSHVLYTDRPIREALEQSYLTGGVRDIVNAMHVYNEIIDPTFSSINNPPQHSARLYLLGDYFHTDYNYVRPARLLEKQFDTEDLVENGYSNTFWDVGEAIRAEYTSEAANRRVIFFARVLYSSKNQPLAILVTEISIDHLERMISRISADMENTYQLHMPDGKLVFQSRDAGGGEDNMIMADAAIAVNDSVLRIGYANTLLRQQLARQWLVFFCLSVLMMLVAFVLIRSISHYVLKRLRQVRVKYERHDLQGLPPPLQGKDEAAFLDQAMTALYEENSRHLQAYYRLQMTYRAMEYQMLMSKINPHFLYNTLSAIKWSLQADQKEEAASAVDRMVAFYRGILGQGSDMVMLMTELEVLGEYARLQAYTYSRDIELKTQVSPETGAKYVLRFLLQPIVENAINHTKQTQQSRIDIVAEKDGEMLRIVVRNNGEPIAPEMMQRLNAYNDIPLRTMPEHAPGQKDRVGYGVFNVIARIRLLFGEQYGLWYDAPEGGGTQATFRLPLLANDIHVGDTVPQIEKSL